MGFALVFAVLLTALFWRNLRDQQNRIERHQKELIELLRRQTTLLEELQQQRNN